MTAMAANLNRPEARATPAYALHEATDGAFRDAMRQLASGVCVVTSGSGPDSVALTAISVSSLSADPPTLLVCINGT
jgi:flavin reductase (DIM6/NTAB) family NADH-FMN oxidoreductase RutF